MQKPAEKLLLSCRSLYTHTFLYLYVLFHDIILRFENMSFRNKSPYPRQRIYVRIPSDDRSRIQNAVAAYFHTISQHCAEFFQSGGNPDFSGLYLDRRFITLDIGGYRPCTHVGFEPQNTVSHIVIMGNLNSIK